MFAFTPPPGTDIVDPEKLDLQKDAPEARH
jgi:hypothetical protein